MSEKKRCPWVPADKEDYIHYHDHEWGVPLHDDQTIFEYLTLEGAQAGLSWYTVLRKREHYRVAYANFDPQIVARFDEAKIQELLQDPGIIRNKLKVYASVNNAKRFLEVQNEFGSFSKYMWSFVGGKPKVNEIRHKGDYMATSTESDAFSKDLLKRGFKFVGSTVIYAHMQATGMVNDHSMDCFRRQEVIDGYGQYA
ncbi:MAG: DNA-3-methyladenine glycosylase I [Bacteroidia bacterium]|nr:DNA-3-methyladenine glycosylase I [Bacteroidia bacterium]